MKPPLLFTLPSLCPFGFRVNESWPGLVLVNIISHKPNPASLKLRLLDSTACLGSPAPKPAIVGGNDYATNETSRPSEARATTGALVVTRPRCRE